MSFFEGVLECNQANGGVHRWGGPQARRRLDGGTDFSLTCEGDCGVTAWGTSEAAAMDQARQTDRLHRRGLLG